MADVIYTMRLRAVGNPDHGQYAPVSNPEVVMGSTFAEMREHAQKYQEDWDLGGGNWTDPVVKQGSKVVGHFSYNLRLWEGRPSRTGADRREIKIEAVAQGGAL
jgi:hypothetical protein